MRDRAPTFPPLLNGHRVPADKNPLKRAKSHAAAGKLGAGDLLWSDDRDNLRFALVLEPDVPRERCPEMLFVAMVALGDAIGALAPPEVAVSYSWPSVILMNAAEIGHVDLLISDGDNDGQPTWMVIAVEICIRPARDAADPGLNPARTTIWDEGCGDITRTELLESTSRHIVNWIHTWSEERFRPVHQQWWGRLTDQAQIAPGVLSIHQGGLQLTGLDENGNALVKGDGETGALDTVEALRQLRIRRGVRV